MKRIVAVALACCALVVALAGCSGGAKSTDAESLSGFWEIDPASAVGFDAAINLDEENFAELVISDAYLEGSWTADGSSASVDFGDGDKANIYVSDGKLVLGQEDGSKLIFIKSDIDEYYSNAAEAEGDAAIEVEGDGEDAGLTDTEIVEEVIDDITPVSVADDSVVKIDVTGKGTDFTGDPGYRLSITNKTDKTIFIVANDAFTVDGSEIEAGLGEVVDPGDTVETFVYFATDDLGGGLEKLKNVKGVIYVGDDDTSNELGTYDFAMD